MKTKIKALWQKFKKSRFLLAVLMLVIGSTYTFCYLEIKREEVFGENQIVVYNTSRVLAEAEAKQENVEERGESSNEIDSPTIGLVKKFFGEEWKTAYAVMMCESRGIADRIGDTHLPKPSIGLFQINQIWHPYTTEELKNPEFNVKIAKDIRDKGGWGRWTCYKTDGYLAFMQ